MKGELPGGVVTFVFTDIEGSTVMFRDLGEAFPPLLEQHNALWWPMPATITNVSCSMLGPTAL